MATTDLPRDFPIANLNLLGYMIHLILDKAEETARKNELPPQYPNESDTVDDEVWKLAPNKPQRYKGRLQLIDPHKETGAKLQATKVASDSGKVDIGEKNVKAECPKAASPKRKALVDFFANIDENNVVYKTAFKKKTNEIKDKIEEATTLNKGKCSAEAQVRKIESSVAKAPKKKPEQSEGNTSKPPSQPPQPFQTVEAEISPPSYRVFEDENGNLVNKKHKVAWPQRPKEGRHSLAEYKRRRSTILDFEVSQNITEKMFDYMVDGWEGEKHFSIPAKITVRRLLDQPGLEVIFNMEAKDQPNIQPFSIRVFCPHFEPKKLWVNGKESGPSNAS